MVSSIPKGLTGKNGCDAGFASKPRATLKQAGVSYDHQTSFKAALPLCPDLPSAGLAAVDCSSCCGGACATGDRMTCTDVSIQV